MNLKLMGRAKQIICATNVVDIDPNGGNDQDPEVDIRLILENKATLRQLGWQSVDGRQ